MTHDWETLRVVIHRAQTYGLGIAISGGSDSKPYKGAIFVSDVLPGGPADGKLLVNDEIMSVNEVSLINATHAQAIHYLKHAGRIVELIVKRRILMTSNTVKQATRKNRYQAYNRYNPGMTIDVDAVASGTFPRRGPRDQLEYPYAVPSSRLDAQQPTYHYSHQRPASPLNSPKFYRRPRSPLRNIGHAASVSAINHTDTYHRRGGMGPAPKNEDLGRSNYSLDCRFFDRDSERTIGANYGIVQDYNRDAPSPVDRQVKSVDDTWEMKLNRRDTWEDLGIELDCRLFVSDVHQNGAAFREGVRVGDTIVAVNGILANNVSLVDASNLLQRPQVTLKFLKHRKLPDDSVQDSVAPPRCTPSASPSPAPVIQNDSKPIVSEPKIMDKQMVPQETPANIIGTGPSSPPPVETKSSPSRIIRFHKDPQLGTGIRLNGGNISGIYVAGVHTNSAAEEHGIVEGDKLLSVNGVSLVGKTKEEAVLELVGLDGDVELEVVSDQESYSKLISSGESGDSFFIRVNFSYDPSSSRLNGVRGSLDVLNSTACLSDEDSSSAAALQANVDCGTVELGFRRGAVFHVRDSLYGGVVGRWQAMQVHPTFGTLGLIPNSHRAEQLALTESFSRANLSDYSTWSAKSNFNQRKKSSFHPSNLGSSFMKKKKSRSQGCLMNASFESLVNLGVNAYERVVQRRPNFMRPVVIIGPTAQSLRTRLAREMPHLFETALPDPASVASRTSAMPASAGVIKLSLIKNIIKRNRHCLLDIAPPAIDRLSVKNFTPIVILLCPQNKTHLKEVLSRTGVSSATSQWKRIWHDLELLDQQWSHLFTERLQLSYDPDEDFRSILDSIQTQQNKLIFMSETCPDPLGDIAGEKASLNVVASNLSNGYECTQPQRSPHYGDEFAKRFSPHGMSHYESADNTNGNFPRSRSNPHIIVEPYERGIRQFSGEPPENFLFGESFDQPDYNRLRNNMPQVRSHHALVHPEILSPRREIHKLDSGFHSSDQPDGPHSRYQTSPMLNDSSRQFLELDERKRQTDCLNPYSLPQTRSSDPLLDTSQSKVSPRLGQIDREVNTPSTSSLHIPLTSSPNLNQSSDIPLEHDSKRPQETASQTTMPQPDPEQIKPSTDSAAQSPPALPPKRELPTEREILAETSAFFDHEGGMLEIADSGVSLHIPPDALPKSNRKQHIFLKIYKDSSALKSLNKERGATLVSPLVMCGPHGLKFLKPVELRLPHYTQKRKSSLRHADIPDQDANSTDSNWSFSLLHASSETGKPQKWSELKLNDRDVVSHVDKETISIMVDHF